MENLNSEQSEITDPPLDLGGPNPCANPYCEWFAPTMRVKIQQAASLAGRGKHEVEHNINQVIKAQMFSKTDVAMANGEEIMWWATYGDIRRDRPKQSHPHFTAESNRPALRYHQAGRNDPCPCGSGKKYKRCCYD